MKGSVQTPQIFVDGADASDLLITRIHDTISTPGTRRPLAMSGDVAVFNDLGPAYILGESYSFLEWNAAFEHLVAKPFALRRGDDVKAFLQRLDNWESEVKAHSVREFPLGAEPDVDTEVFQFQHPDYGLVVAQKFACRLRHDKRLWCVSLNVTFVQRGNLWKSLMRLVQRDATWGRYAECYDVVISSFSENKKLVNKVVEQIGVDRVRCLDVGAGTGSTTIELLRKNPSRRVHAIEPNGGMIRRLRQNLEASNNFDRVDISYADCLCALKIVLVQRELEESSGRVSE